VHVSMHPWTCGSCATRRKVSASAVCPSVDWDVRPPRVG
jgi:hypothetical protein